MAASGSPGSEMETNSLPALLCGKRPTRCSSRLPVVGQEGQRLGGGARLGGDDADGAGRVEDLVVGSHRRRVGGVEDVDIEALVGLGVDQRQHLGRERGAAHAADERVGVALAFDLPRRRRSARRPRPGRTWVRRASRGGAAILAATSSSSVQRLVSRGPDAAGPALPDGPGDGLVDGALQLCGQRECGVHLACLRSVEGGSGVIGIR